VGQKSEARWINEEQANYIVLINIKKARLRHGMRK
jgi:hypothetical protein